MPSFPDFSEKEFRDRISKATKMMKEHDLDALLLSEFENVYYLSGFHSRTFYRTRDFPYVLIVKKDGTTRLVIRGSMENVAQETSWVTDVVGYRMISDAAVALKDSLSDLGLKGAKVGAELGEIMAVKFSTGLFLDLYENSGVKFVDGAPAMWETRAVKSDFELRRLKKAAEIASRAIESAFNKLKPGMTEWELSTLVGANMMKEESEVWLPIVQSGEKVRLGLGGTYPSERKIRRGDIVQVDWGATYRHYNSDLNRMAMVGRRPTQEERDHWNIFVEANKAGIKAVRPGVTAAGVFSAMEEVFEEHGLKNTNVRAGHGIGLEAHEPPHLGSHDQTTIKPGMAFAIEPYGVPNKEGNFKSFNCEDDVICTETGSKRISTVGYEIF